VPIRLGFFFGIFAVMALWELAAPRRRLTQPKALRWANNIGLVFFNSFLARLVFPLAAVGMAVFAREHGWGVLNYFAVPYWLAVIAAVVVLDFFDLAAACDGPCGACAVASAPGASCRSGLRRDDRRALPPAGDRLLSAC
jgi:hypothetical protein